MAEKENNLNGLLPDESKVLATYRRAKRMGFAKFSGSLTRGVLSHLEVNESIDLTDLKK